MEFGLFLNGYLPGPGAHDTEAEHTMLMRELQYPVHADRYNWKYVWIGEHHGLTEYSHMSAPETVFGWIAAQTERIHMGSAIMNLSPVVNHPVRNAERVAMLDHITGGRYEWGTGRGAGSHEVATFGIMDTSETKAMWDEAAPEILRMFEQKDYTFEGEYFRVPTPHNILPKPYGTGHPPMWVACGNPATFAKAGSLGIGAIAFNFEPIMNLKGRIESYKEAAAECSEPIGQFQNDNVMMTNAVVCLADRDRAREIAISSGRGYLNTMVTMYHDTMPKMEGAVTWPGRPNGIADEATLDWAIEAGYLLCGNPEEVNEQIQRYQEVGTDQLVFGIPNEGFQHEEVLEMIELFGSEVIPNYDTDPEHSTTKMRATAKPKHPTFANPLPEFDMPEVIPENAIIPLGG
ncbi:MAG: LLM class flavin-dependent oxidoreductase [Microthrixaceae bacterium]|nr:LLM class flavin-dependent oxidoreductase [Microthrixaceae bacterium]MCO5319422.1 LLM class flavin-dependent oxidoreductase [Microthrixaceae bacterium]